MRIGIVKSPLPVLRPAPCVQGQRLFHVSTAQGDLIAADLVEAKTGDRVLVLTGSCAERICMQAPLDAVIAAVLSPL